MRMQTATTTSAPCATYGLASHAGFLFERQRTAMRQSAFARARSAMTKRKARDSDESDDNSSGDELQRDQQQRPSKRVVLHGLKRMRVSSPPSTSSATSLSALNTATQMSGTTAWPRATTSSADAMSDVAMDDDGSAVTSDALVPVGKPRGVSSTHPLASAWSAVLPGATYASTSELQMPPTDASCRALVLFASASAVPRGLSPRIELVESDDDGTRSASDDDDSTFVRFEEIHDDDDGGECDSMEID